MKDYKRLASLCLLRHGVVWRVFLFYVAQHLGRASLEP